MRKLTKLQRELIEILKRLGGKATTREISTASGRHPQTPYWPRIGTNSVSQSLSYMRDYVKYCGMQSKGNALWELIREPEVKKTPDLQKSLNFDDAS